MKTLMFYDMKTRKKFSSSKYTIKKRKVKDKTRRFAVATAPSGIKAWRVL